MMDNICRLCCSANYVNNDIFDEENALYLKMSLYLPIKVFRNDQLPQRVCDKCSCKVNDFYQFCNETIEVQNRLRSLLQSSDIKADALVDLTIIKDSPSPAPAPNVAQQAAHQATQTDDVTDTPKPVITQFKVEPQLFLTTVKQETLDEDSDCRSSSSEDMSLINLKQSKGSPASVNGKTSGKGVKKKHKVKWEASSPTINAWQDVSMLDVKPKEELDETKLYNCCICLTQCYGRNEIINHYREHGQQAAAAAPPAAPADPDQDPVRCMRCDKKVAAREWRAHWQRHYERDRRPLRCALCEHTYRDTKLIFKHGLTHTYEKGATRVEPEVKRFLCDMCPQGFVHMRYLLSHRTAAHPEALSRALAMRCGVCRREFAHLNSLRRHLRAHTGERNFLCNVCGKSLTSREHLKFHIRIHTGYKPNVCKTCGKGFVKKCNLMLHERVHSGEKPYVCSACGKAFSQRSTLVIHERYHSGARPYACALCGKGFVAKGLLTMHLKSTCLQPPAPFPAPFPAPLAAPFPALTQG